VQAPHIAINTGNAEQAGMAIDQLFELDHIELFLPQ